jgi:hypothetical protein
MNEPDEKRRRGSASADAPAAATLAPPKRRIPCYRFDVHPSATNNKYLFLREIGGPACLKVFLDRVAYFGEKSLHWGGTLIVDQPVTLTDGITVPPGFTLAGVGREGFGRLRVSVNGLKTPGAPAVTLSGGSAVLRDLTVESSINSLEDTAPIGIRLEGAGPFYLDGIHVYSFKSGIQGIDATNVFISNSNIDGNRIGIEMIGRCRHWRVRDSEIRQSPYWGIVTVSTAGVGPIDTQIDGCVLEGNGAFYLPWFPGFGGGAILLNESFATRVGFCRFENNGYRYCKDNPWILNPLPFECAEPIQVNYTHTYDCAKVSGTAKTLCALRVVANTISSDQFKPGDLNDPNMPFQSLTDAVVYGPPLFQPHLGFNSQYDWGTTSVNQWSTSRINERTTYSL